MQHQQNNSNNKSIIGITLVTGATGSQGSAVVKYLLQGGHKVRAVTRDLQKSSELTAYLTQYPELLEIVKGSYEDFASLQAALKGVTGVFSVQVPSFTDETAERTQATTLINLAKQAGVKTFVQTTVNRAGKHDSFPRWKEGYWNKGYWISKSEVEDAVKKAGFESYTILKPGTFNKNFVPPMAEFFFPGITKGEIVLPVSIDTKLNTIDTDDIGKFAAAVFEDPQRFNKKLINLGSEPLTIKEIGEVLSRTLGTSIKFKEVTPEEAVKQGMAPFAVNLWEWLRDVGYKGDENHEKDYGIPLTSFEEWARRNIKKL